MNCPYCGREREPGVIQSPQELAWKKRRAALLGAAELQEGSVMLAEVSFGKGSCVTAYLCRVCGKVILDTTPAGERGEA